MKTSIGLCGATGKTPELQIGQVKTVDYTQKASVEITGTRENPILNFNIPKGKDGAKLIIKEIFNGDIEILNNIDATPSTSDIKSVISTKGIKEFKKIIERELTENKDIIGVLTSRINELTTLVEGSTTGDAELKDARVGFDGVSYNNVGDAIRGQVKYLNKKITTNGDAIKNAINTEFKQINEVDLTKLQGNYLSSHGLLVENEGYDVYQLNVEEGETYKLVAYYIYDIKPYTLYNNDRVVIVGGDKGQIQEVQTFNGEITIPQGVNKMRICSGTSGRAKFTLEKQYAIKPLNKSDIGTIISTHKYEGLGAMIDCSEKYNITKGFYLARSGNTVEDQSSCVSDYINIDDITNIYVSGNAQYNTCLMCVYDINKKFIKAYGFSDNQATKWNNNLINNKEIQKENPNAQYMRFGSYMVDTYPLKIYENKNTIIEGINEIVANIGKANVLHGKKWVACGDSYTEGDFTTFVDENGLSGKNSPVIFDKNMNMYKTYPWWIAKRNDMELINEAKCGTTIYNNGSSAFSVERYKKIPLDADYITLMFGLNEGSAPIGELSDTTNNTVIGAYNVVLEYLMTNIPYAKIGIIVSDAWLGQELHDAIVSVSEYWGVPCLDLKGDNKIPLSTGGRLNNINLNPKAQQLRDKSFYVSDNNHHPNVKAHEYRSTIIENFLRSL